MSAQLNPYAPPKAYVSDVAAVDSAAESIRQEHIKHEAAVRSIGILYYIGGSFALIGAIFLLIAGAAGLEQPVGYVLGGVYFVLGALSIVVGRGIRLLQPWARTTSVVLSVIGLLGFPIGTLINGYILYLLLAAKGKRIFEADYQAIRAATPQIKYRTSIGVWIALGLLMLLILGVVASIAIPALRA